MTAAPGSAESVLEHERQHLDLARQQLGRMREAALALDASKASDAVSGEALSATLMRRVQALIDDPKTTLFFGRIDWCESPEAREEKLYIGRRHVSNEDGDPLVIDWRAPVATAFYRASPAEPMGVSLRRRFGVDRGQITAFEDERLAGTSSQVEGDGGASGSILAEEIERPRSGPMRDIVSTIQPEQDALVRQDVGETVCIQGAPGTGKTAVGLHRAAWLLYSFRAKLDRSGVLVVGPNAAFLDHISAVLPSLGEARVKHATIDSLLAAWPVKREDNTATAVLKGDARWADVIRRAVWSHVNAPTEALVVPRGSRRWRVPAYEVAEIVERLRGRDIRYEAARGTMAQQLAHAVLLQMEAAGDSPDDRVQDAIARSAPVKAYIKTLWPKIDAAAVMFRLWSDPEFLQACADGTFSSAELTQASWAGLPKMPRTKGSAKWTRADLALLDEATDVIERTASLGHVIVDEAQDLSPMQLRAIGRRCSTGSATVLGDVAQATTAWAPGSWDVTMAHLGKPAYSLTELRQGFRVPASVIDYAARLLPTIAPGLAAPQSVRSNPGVLEHHVVDADERAGTVAEVAGQLSENAGSVGVIGVADELASLESALREAGVSTGRLDAEHGDDDDHQVELVPAHIAKGLEFDRVIVVEPSHIVEATVGDAEGDERAAAEITALRHLYVVLTRAVSELHIVRSEPMPDALAD